MWLCTVEMVEGGDISVSNSKPGHFSRTFPTVFSPIVAAVAAAARSNNPWL